MNDKRVSLEAIRPLICARLDIEPSLVTRSSTFVSDLGADSLDVIEIGMAIEEMFAVTIPQADYATFVTVGDALDYLETRQSGLVASIGTR